jgi:hypothetical protein
MIVHTGPVLSILTVNLLSSARCPLILTSLDYLTMFKLPVKRAIENRDDEGAKNRPAEGCGRAEARVDSRRGAEGL